MRQRCGWDEDIAPALYQLPAFFATLFWTVVYSRSRDLLSRVFH